jgi:hypothetical protein
MGDIDRFWIVDSTVCVGVKSFPFDWHAQGREGDWKNYKAVREVLRGSGYVLHDDPNIRERFPSLKRTHHAGSKGPVHFHSEIYPAGFRYEFYEDVPRENPCGGRYGFDKMGRAPYLWRLRVTQIHRKIAQALEALGFRDDTEIPPKSAVEAVTARQDGWKKSHPYIFKDPPERYNATDQDGVLLQGGELRYFYSHNGRLERGIVYRSAGNCWDVVLNKTEWRAAVGTHDMFTYNPERHPRKLSRDPVYMISKALERAITARKFRKAAVIQEALERITGSHTFKEGDPVVVENPRYHGRGVVESTNPPFSVDVRLESSGNVRRYEWPTVKPATQGAIA